MTKDTQAKSRSKNTSTKSNKADKNKVKKRTKVWIPPRILDYYNFADKEIVE